MFATVLLVICLNAPMRIGCTTIPVTDNTQAQDDGQVPNFLGCMGAQGFFTAKKYWDEHPDMHDHFQFGGWACRIENQQKPKGGKA